MSQLTPAQYATKKISRVASQDALNRLENIIASKYPTVPEKARTRPEKFFYGNTGHREYLSRWLEAVICWIIQNDGYLAKKVETVGKKIKNKANKEIYIKHRAAKKGEPDVTSTIAGRTVYWEVKVGADTVKDDQRDFHDRARNAGALVFVVKSVDEFFINYDNLIS